MVFKNKIKKNEVFDYPVFSHKDLSWTATFDKSEVKDFIAQKFDYLFCLSIAPSPILIDILLNSKANCRAGLQTRDNEPLFDLMVYSRKKDISPGEIGEQIIALVKMMKDLT